MKIQDKGNYLIIEAEEGKYLTPFKDGDIKTYFSSRKCVCLKEKSDNIREITEEENNHYLKLQEEALNGKDR